jgi:16S rRNA processing protein RimM
MDVIVIGKIVAPIGIRGEVKVLVLTDFPERFEAGSELAIRSPKGECMRAKIASARTHKDGLALKLEGIDSRSDAETLRGCEFVIDQSELAELPAGRFYVFDIIGLKVTTEDGRECGEVIEVLAGGANDVYVTSTGLCIPALHDVVAKVDVDKREMVIRSVPGLLD